MSDSSRDDDGAGAKPWAPSTDANSERAERPRGAERPERAAKPARARAADGDAPLRRRPAKAAPAAGPETEGAPAASREAPREASEAAPQEVPDAAPEGERIAKAIARAGIASRRDAEALILAGRVSLNGQVLDSPAVNVTDADQITVDGEPLPARERTRLWLFHKPRGLVTTARDPEGRPTVFEALPDDLPRVVAVGRLDINTEGLLLLTNDGGLAKVIAHPDTGWLRRYRVRAHGDTDQAQLDRLRKGVTIDGMEYGPVEAILDRVQGDNLWLTLGLREGKNREVKRILEHLGLSVNRLIRLSFGPFQLGDLESGLVDEVRTKVLKEQLGKSLAEQAGVDFESPVREPIAPFGASAKKRAAQPGDRAERDGADEAPRAARGRREGSARPDFERPARAKAPERVPTGGMGPGPRRSVWRADAEGEAPRGRKVPRRGADPRGERASAAERGRERVGAINTGERRVLVERLAPSAPAPAEAAAEAPKRRRYARDEAARPAARERRGEGEAVRAPRSERGMDARGPDARGSERAGRRPPRQDEGAAPRGARSGARETGERTFGDRPGGRPAGKPGGRFGDRPGGRSGERSEGRPGGAGRGAFEGRGDGAPARGGGRPGGFKGEARGAPKPGGRGAGARGDAPRSGGFKEGGFKGGGFKGSGARGGAPAGAGPGRGGPKGGGRPGGRPGGGRPPRGAR